MSSKHRPGSLPKLTSAQKDIVTPFVVEAIKGFTRSIQLGENQPTAYVLQDILRLLTLWFGHGANRRVYEQLEKELENVSAENWLRVVPQLIARMHIPTRQITNLLQKVRCTQNRTELN